jgi:hypothetical protein
MYEFMIVRWVFGGESFVLYFALFAMYKKNVPLARAFFSIAHSWPVKGP